MPEDWFEWVGRTIADDIPLLEFLGGAGDTAVFSTAIVDRQGVVKLVSMDAEQVKQRAATFKLAEKLSHPHLLRVFRGGKCQVDEEHLAYMVTEFAAENVAQVLPERNLTSDETLALMTATLGALQYLHAQGFVHADLKPSNIMATGNQVKISVDGVHRIGEPLARNNTTPYDAPEAKAVLTPASDMWSLGVTISKVLTQRVAESPKDAAHLEKPFRDIVQRCLTPEPELRPSIIDVHNMMEGKFVPPPHTGASAVTEPDTEEQAAEPVAKVPRPRAKKTTQRKGAYKIPLFAGVAIAIIVALVLAFGNRKTSEPTGTSETPATSSTPRSKPPASEDNQPPAITRRVIPDVAADARGTITGTVHVAVRVKVGPDGDVTDTDLVALGPSRYFDNLATQAAGQWKFAKAPHPSTWELQFNFSKKETTVVPTPIIH